MRDYRIDGTKIMFHPHRVAQLLDGRGDWEKAKSIYPIYVEVSPVGACNHRCTFCAVDYIGYKANMLDADIFRWRIEEMASLGVRSIMFAGEGEPLLHKRINDFVNMTWKAGVDVSFTTNGVLLDKLDLANCTWVKVSLNAGTSETYQKIHRGHKGDWEKVWANLKDAVSRKGGCTLGVQMVILPENQSEIPQLEALCTEAGVDYLVLKPYSQHKFSITKQYEGFPPLPEVSGGRLIVRKEAIDTKAIGYDKCHATPYLWAYIMADGSVYSCSAYLLDKRFELGNINSHGFQDIWESEKRKANWELVLNTLNINECRVNCRMHRSNVFLEELAKGVPHQNFI